MSAVSDLYGPVQARLSAEDWLSEFESENYWLELQASELRLVTIAAAARLASSLISTSDMGADGAQDATIKTDVATARP